MFEYEWGNTQLWESQEVFLKGNSRIIKEDIEYALNLRWEEHCLECAMPECYNSCPLYSRRKDGACSRFEYGIVLNKNFKGIYGDGADIKFKKWGKIEANLSQTIVDPVSEDIFVYIIESHSENSDEITTMLFPKNSGPLNLVFDEFVVECYSPYPFEYKLILEYFTEKSQLRKTKFREFFVIKEGYNIFKIPFGSFQMEQMDGYVYLYPESAEPPKRVIFTCLGFLKYRKPILSSKNPDNQTLKIKCLIWDLDNTLWDGILSEDEQVFVRKDALQLIKALDERGIIQSIASKNDHDSVWTMLTSLKIESYFLYPAINWGQKSENIRMILKRLNIDQNAAAFVDDSLFERKEVSSNLSGIRTYSEKNLLRILSYDEFDVPDTFESRSRRLSYQDQVKREQFHAAFSGSYDNFLKSCQMTVEVSIPQNKNEILRCWELIQRSNQLNLSGNRYSFLEFNDLITDSLLLSLAINCRDKYGNYGLVGYSTLSLKDGQPSVIDFVLSCRVAQKKVEHFFFNRLSNFLFEKGHSSIAINLIKTSKNLPLREMFTTPPFLAKEDKERTACFELYRPYKLEDDDLLKFSFLSSFETDYDHCRKQSELAIKIC